MFKTLLPSFSEELFKIAASPQERAEEKLRVHFQKPDWKSFEKNLKRKSFQNAVLKSELSDKKLKKYVKNVTGYSKSKDIVGRVQSRTSNKIHDVKRLPSGRLSCSCGDWKYHHSVRSSDCDHIKAVKNAGLVKKSYVVPLLASARALGQSTREVAKGEEMKRFQKQLPPTKHQHEPIPLWKDIATIPLGLMGA